MFCLALPCELYRMIFDKFISLPVFLIALSIGLVFMYMTPASMTRVVVYPTPDNKDDFLYGDSANNCFQFEQIETQCPSDRSLIKEIPFQGKSGEGNT